MGKLAWSALVLGLISCGPVRDDNCIDEDDDGVCIFDDVDDNNAKCGTDPTDADGDGACLGIDCDDSTATGAACFEGCLTVYPDKDGDGFGDEASVTTKCSLSQGFVADTGLFDCDDNSRDRIPIDFDGDGYNTCDDCNDSDPAIHPGAAEVCDGGIDNDCNPATDETTGDPDGDGFLGCADFCPLTPDGTAPTEIVWEWLETSTASAGNPCGCALTNQPINTGTYSFTINDTPAGSAASTSMQCSCESPIQSLTTPPTNWNPTAPSNALAFTIATNANANNLVAWVRARLKYADATERLVCVFDHLGGDCTNPDLCQSQFCDANAACASYTRCPATEFTEPVVAQVDADNDGYGATCDCADANANRNPGRLELCNNNIDDDCDGMVDMMDDECLVCNRTRLTEANLCDNGLDDDCDGKMDGEDEDCIGSICLNPVPIPLIRDGVHDRRTGDFDLCRVAPTDTVNTACGTAESQPDHWQRVTVYDPAEKGYRIEYCFDGQVGELLASDMFACGTDLECLKRFVTPGPNNCVIDPPTGSYQGTRTVPLVFRGMPTCGGGNQTAIVNWRITVLPP